MSKRKFILFALVAALVLSFAGSAFATEWTWIGHTRNSTDWNASPNWEDAGVANPGTLPEDEDDVVIPAGVTVRIDAAAVANSITFEAPAPDTETAPTVLEVNDTLTVGDVGNAGGATKITANHDVNITGNDAGEIALADDAAVTTKNISVAAGKTLNVGVQLRGDNQVTTLNKTGAGTLVLESDGAAANRLIINAVTAGTLRLTHQNQVSAAAAITVAAGATLELDGTFTLNVANQRITLGGVTSRVVIGENGNVTTAGNANPFGGGAVGWPLVINGTLTLADDNGAASFANRPSVTVGEGGHFNIATDAAAGATAETINSLVGAGSVELRSAGGLNIAPIAGTPNFEFEGTITDVLGAGPLTYNAAAQAMTFTLSGPNEYSVGGTTVTLGTLVLATEGSISDICAVNLNGGVLRVDENASLRNPVTVGAASTINVPADVTLTLRGVVSTAAGGLTKTGPGELVLSGTGNVGVNALTVNAGTLTIAQSAADVFPLTVNARGRLNIAAPNLVHNGAGAVTFAQYGATFVADVTQTSKFVGDVPGTPYFNATGATGIVTGGAGVGGVNLYFRYVGAEGVKKGDSFLLFQSNNPAAPLLNRTHFIVVDELGHHNTDYEVEHFSQGAITNALKVTALRNIDAPVQPGAPSFTPTYDGENVKLTFTAADPTGAAYKIIHTATDRIIAEDVLPAATAVGTTFTVSIPVDLLPSKSYTVEVAGYTTTKDFPVAGTAPTTVPAPTGPANDTADGSTGTLTFTIPATDIPSSKAFSAWVWLDDGTVKRGPVLVDLASASGGYKLTVLETDIDRLFPAEDYPTLSVSAIYQLTADATVTGRTESETVRVEGSDDKPGNGGGGCDAGFGLFGLLAATGAVALLRRKG